LHDFPHNSIINVVFVYLVTEKLTDHGAKLLVFPETAKRFCHFFDLIAE